MCLALAELLAKEALRNVLLFCGVLTAIVSMYMVLATAKKKQTADLLLGAGWMSSCNWVTRASPPCMMPSRR